MKFIFGRLNRDDQGGGVQGVGQGVGRVLEKSLSPVSDGDMVQACDPLVAFFKRTHHGGNIVTQKRELVNSFIIRCLSHLDGMDDPVQRSVEQSILEQQEKDETTDQQSSGNNVNFLNP